MNMPSIALKIIEDRLNVWRFVADANLKNILPEQGFFSLTRTKDELSLVCNRAFEPPSDLQGKVECGWRAFQVVGPLDFSLVGIMSRLTQPLADASISIFAISTFDTDYLLVKDKDFELTKAVLASKFEMRN